MNFFPLLASTLVSGLSIWFLSNSQLVHRLLDIPNDRSLHVKPVPRIGGAGLLAGAAAGWLFAGVTPVWWIWGPTLLLFFVSLLDDLISLPVRQRMLAHLMAATIVAWGSGVATSYGVLLMLLVLPGIIWMTNLFNFMDGSNGLAGGMALFGFACYGLASLMAGSHTYALLNFSITASALVFLLFNFHPARVFMGDAGSIPLGFLAAALGLSGWLQHFWPAWFPFLVFAPFIVDATVTLIRRTLRGVKITEAHREHYYQRLIQSGWSHRKLALAEYALMLATGGSALLFVQEAAPWQLLLFWALAFAILMLLTDRRWHRYCKEQTC